MFLSYNYKSLMLLHIHFSFNLLLINVVLTSIWCIINSYIEDITTNTHINVILVAGEYVSKWSTPYFCMYPLSTSRSFNLSIERSDLSLFLNAHLQPTCLQSLGKSTNSHVWLNIIDSMSELIAYFQKVASINIIASA